MLQEVETLLCQALKQFILKPELLITEFHQLYAIYKDLKGTLNGNPKSEN